MGILEYLNELAASLLSYPTSNFIGMMTVINCVVGVVLGSTQAWFFHGQDDPLARKLRNTFITDAAIYFVTMLFGIAVYLRLESEQFEYIHFTRICVLGVDLWANYILYSHYRSLWKYVNRKNDKR